MNKTLQQLACEDMLGQILPEDLPAAAANALAEGCDSPALRILAGLTAIDAGQARTVFHRALWELNVPRPSKRDAVMNLAREAARRILSREITPYEGAKRIWDLSLLLPNEHLPELDSFVYAASEWEDRPTDRKIFEEGIAAAARQLVST